MQKNKAELFNLTIKFSRIKFNLRSNRIKLSNQHKLKKNNCKRINKHIKL